MLKNDLIKIVICSLGFCFLLLIFNNIADLYEMSTFHRVISIFIISLTHAFFQPLFFLFDKELKKNQVKK